MIFGIFTTQGIANSIDAAENEGFYVFPTSFGVSDVAGDLLKTRTAPTAGEFYTAPVSSRIPVDSNTVKIVCTIPQSQTVGIKDIKEVVLYAKNSADETFLLALGQPTEDLIYNPDGTVTLEVQIALLDVDVEGNYIFNNTQATEIAEHTVDPNAHPEIITAISKAGILIPNGSLPQEHRGQSYQQNVEFDGTKAVAVAGGINFSSKYNGTEGNSISLTFDNALTVDEVIVIWNNANPDNMVLHDGVGTEVLAVQTVNLVGGSYLVANKQNVYKDVDGIYKLAIADGSKRTNAVASARIEERMVVFGTGLLDITTGIDVGDKLYLSSTVEGAFSDINNGVSLGIVLEAGLILYTGFNASADIESSQTFEAVVTDITGLGLYSSSQNAVDDIASGSRILVDKLEFLKATIDTKGKTLDFVFNGVDKGWTKFLGQVASFKMDFNAVPDAGTFRMEWKGQESADMLFNASANDIETEFNLFSGHTGVLVAGSFAAGFTFTFADEFPQPVPTFVYAGHNEVQRFEFGNIPNNGTIQFAHDANNTLNFPWDDNAVDLKIALEALASISNLTITGSFADQFFEMEFDGGVLVDGLQPRNEISVIASALDQTGVPTSINGTDPASVPIDPITVIQGKYPASNLRTAGGANTDVIITVTELSSGEPVGPETAITLDASNISITGYGLVQNFENGIDINGQDQAVISMRFDNVVNPILASNLKAGVDIDLSNTLGYAKDILAQLKLSEHPSNNKRVVISGANELLASGVELSQELNSLLLEFDGAQIDFSTGLIFKADGVTSLGLDFTPVTPIAEKFRWASITIIPKIETIDTQIQGQVLILFGDEDGDTKALAPKAAFADGKPLGQIVLEGDLGEEEITLFITTRDQFSNLDTKHIVIYDDIGSVAVWVDVDNNGSIEPAHGADRSIKVIGVVENDDPNNVAIAFNTVINADSKFSSVRVNNRITVTSIGIGERTDANAGTTAFDVSIVQQGRSTDVTGLVDIKNSAIKQLGSGSGGGSGGAGPGDLFLQDLKFELQDSQYMLLDHNIGSIDTDTKLDALSTASYSIPDKAFKFQSGEIIQSTNQLDAVEFLAAKVDISEIGITARWLSNGIDNAAVWEVSRNAGNEFQTISMNRVGSSDSYYGKLEFSNEAVKSTLSEYSVTNADGTLELNNTTGLQRSQEFITSANTDVYQQLTVYLDKIGSPLGSLYLKIVKDNAGSPSTDVADIVFESLPQSISSIGSGDSTLVVEIPSRILDISTKHHIVFYTDSTYQASYSSGTTVLSIRSDIGASSIADSQKFNGTIWSVETGSSLVYLLEGRTLDLRVKVTAGSNDSLLLGYGIFYYLETQVVSSIGLPIKMFDVVPTALAVSLSVPWNINPDFLKLNVDGILWEFPQFSIQAPSTIVIPSGTFDGLTENTLIIVKQIEGGSYTPSTDVLASLAESYIGPNNRASGHGPVLEGPDNLDYEVYIKADFTLDIKLKV